MFSLCFAFAHGSRDGFEGNPLLLAAFGGSLVTRASASLAFVKHQRAMTAPDVLHNLGKAFVKAFPDS
ncbi:hypothetical protein KXD40_004180 [Peronospora effusa]|uniref:YjeF C-terminal domain-containing protein n=1 Tax=Peronospora effusa TaxID=542832 RepID=A0A3R7WJF6_9STRA|nr:hypothetical protein DD237_007376 [Peronospora effusa]UIZ27999.1 hypothetical protein KXD40_004180 [Peronospora effusa]